MLRLSLGFGFVFLLVSFSAVAVDTNQKDYAVSFGVGSGSGLSIKKALGESTWIFANASLSAGKTEVQNTFNGATVTTSSTNRNYSMSAGVRQYLSNEKLSRFIQLSLAETYSTFSSNGLPQTSSRSYVATAGYGLEYFIDTHISVEGIVGLNYTYNPSSSSLSNVSSRNTSFPVVGTAITYYW